MGSQPVLESEPENDVCLVVEGTYPYVAGGVSSWTHDIITSLPHLKFHLLAILPPNPDTKLRYEVPENVTGITQVELQKIPKLYQGRKVKVPDDFFDRLFKPLIAFQLTGSLASLDAIIRIIAPHRPLLNQAVLLDSKPAWKLMLRMYNELIPNGPFLDFFWTWRFLLGNLFTLLLSPLPKARLYHPVSTGYAGLYSARARLETCRPVMLTEHGIYTNERRIEIAMADWLYERPSDTLSIDDTVRDIKSLWIGAFKTYSVACYEGCEKIITLFEGNQKFQIADGANPEKMSAIPNGIDWQTFAAIERNEDPDRPPTIALIGRVVPIKDIKSFLRSCALIKEVVGNVRVWIMGPTDEDQDYFDECQDLVQYLALEDTVEFTGRVKLVEYLGDVDVMVLTSISEGQPLVILEAGAAGIPSVSTDVGACSEMLLGRSDEDPPLGPAGAISPVANPVVVAEEVVKLLTNRGWFQRCQKAIAERIRTYYDKEDLKKAYGGLYEELKAMDDVPRPELDAQFRGDG
ncbi:MAG: GT4 family glycosyltransferase PelF [Magnetococcales bacterium]|nr:GT4 family glycosyltransferase PelF [Magnetococcales bacterium]